jgi:Ca2+-binding EF-hand superfamily protein
LKQLQQAEIRRLFNKVDMARKGSIDKSQFELLLMAMGHNVSVRQMGE